MERLDHHEQDPGHHGREARPTNQLCGCDLHLADLLRCGRLVPGNDCGLRRHVCVSSFARLVIGVASTSGSLACSRPTCVTETSGSPMSRTFWSKPCSAAWSTTGPRMTVVPSLLWVRLSPSNQPVHRESRCPWMRIS